MNETIDLLITTRIPLIGCIIAVIAAWLLSSWRINRLRRKTKALRNTVLHIQRSSAIIALLMVLLSGQAHAGDNRAAITWENIPAQSLTLLGELPDNVLWFLIGLGLVTTVGTMIILVRMAGLDGYDAGYADGRLSAKEETKKGA